MVHYTCDMCGKKSTSILKMGFIPMDSNFRSLFADQSWKGDLCKDCRMKVLDYITKRKAE